MSGPIWSYRSLREIGTYRARIDWVGNVTFAVGGAIILASITYGIPAVRRAQYRLSSRLASAETADVRSN